tara:strand:+ start:3568 stop:4485 length:918 start_codon:yes stop_codon:yes gene_type:complete
MSVNTANTSVLISFESIQQQIQHCENIVENIDKLVPNLYKIRQQALAQKNYITDVQHALSNNNKQLASTSSNDKVYVKTEGGSVTGGATAPLTGDNIPTVLVVSAPSTDVTDTSGNADIGTSIKYKNKQGVAITKNIISDVDKLRDVVQSLYKFKHDQGTSYHFTTQQIDGTANGDIRKKGLNLLDVESITEGLNDYLSISDKDVAGDSNSVAETKIKNTVLKLFAPVENTAAATLTNGSTDVTGGIDTTKLNELKGPFTSSNGDVTKELTLDREVKAKRKVFTGSNGDAPTPLDYRSILTFGLN